jgi:hypothetical protein
LNRLMRVVLLRTSCKSTCRQQTNERKILKRN